MPISGKRSAPTLAAAATIDFRGAQNPDPPVDSAESDCNAVLKVAELP
jgi:hypothetical protein